MEVFRERFGWTRKISALLLMATSSGLFMRATLMRSITQSMEYPMRSLLTTPEHGKMKKDYRVT